MKRTTIIFTALLLSASIMAGYAQQPKQNLTGVYKNTRVYGKLVSPELDSYLKITSDSTAFLYGNGDMFDCGREDREVNYFVAPLADFWIKGEVVGFTLYVSSFDLLTRPVDLSITSAAEAICKGYVQDTDWGMYTVGFNRCFQSEHFYIGKKYITGLIKKNGTIWLDLYPASGNEQGCLFVKVK